MVDVHPQTGGRAPGLERCPRTNLSVCRARLRQLYRDGSPTHALSTAFFRAAACFLGFPVGSVGGGGKTGTVKPQRQPTGGSIGGWFGLSPARSVSFSARLFFVVMTPI